MPLWSCCARTDRRNGLGDTTERSNGSELANASEPAVATGP